MPDFSAEHADLTIDNRGTRRQMRKWERPTVGNPLRDINRRALIVAAGALVGGIALRPTQAADLGGACCADLSERVAGLEATTARKGNRRVSLTLSGQLSGQVNRSMLYWNDGFQSDVYSVDNSLATSRLRLLGSARIDPALQAGFAMELDIRIGSRSNQVNQFDDDGFSGSGGLLGGAARGDGVGGAGDSVVGLRTANWWIESKHLGKLTVGRLYSSTDGISVIDLSNTGVIASSEPGLWGGGMFMRNGLGATGSSTWASQCGGPSGAGPYSDDCAEAGSSRRDAVRYDTPTFAGFFLSASFGEDDFWDVAARYTGEFHGIRVAAGIGYRRYEDREPDMPVVGLPSGKLEDTDRRHWLTSASVLHVASGLFVSGAYTRYEFHGTNANEVIGGAVANGSRPDIALWYVNGGIQRNWGGMGNTTSYGEYGRVDDGTAGLLAATAYSGLGGTGTVLSSEMTWWGFGAVQAIDAAGMELYIGYRNYQAVATSNGAQITGGLQDIWYVQAGARIQF